MKQQSSLANNMTAFQHTYDNKQQMQQPNQNLSSNLPPAQNSSISLQKLNQDHTPSISQKIIKYTNQLKGFLLSKIQNGSKSTISENMEVKGKGKYQSSKNMLKFKDSKEKLKSNNKSVKHLKRRSQSSNEQYLIIKANRNNQNNCKQERLQLTSLSKVVEDTLNADYVVDNQQKCSIQQMNDFEKRISKLEGLVKTLIDKNGPVQKENQQQILKISRKKSVIRCKPLVSLDKKKSLSLNNPQDKPRQMTVHKGEQKVEEKRKSFKFADQHKRSRNSKQNLKPFFAFKKEGLQLNLGYQSILEDKRKNSRKLQIKNNRLGTYGYKEPEQVAYKYF